MKGQKKKAAYRHKLLVENVAASSGPEFGFSGNSVALDTVVTSPITGDSSQAAWEADHLWKRRAEFEVRINNSPVVGAGAAVWGSLMTKTSKRSFISFALMFSQVWEQPVYIIRSVNASQQKSFLEMYTPTASQVPLAHLQQNKGQVLLQLTAAKAWCSLSYATS